MEESNKKFHELELDPIVEEYKLTGLGVIGSRAKGSHRTSSDYDFIATGPSRKFINFYEDGVLIEIHRFESSLDWKSKPNWWLALRHLKVLWDNTGEISQVQSNLDDWFNSYTSNFNELSNNKYWIESLRRKLVDRKADLVSKYLVATNCWEIFRGLCLVRNLPIPGNSEMFELLTELIGIEQLNALLGSNPEMQLKMAIQLCDEILQK